MGKVSLKEIKSRYGMSSFNPIGTGQGGWGYSTYGHVIYQLCLGFVSFRVRVVTEYLAFLDGDVYSVGSLWYVILRIAFQI